MTNMWVKREVKLPNTSSPKIVAVAWPYFLIRNAPSGPATFLRKKMEETTIPASVFPGVIIKRLHHKRFNLFLKGAYMVFK